PCELGGPEMRPAPSWRITRQRTRPGRPFLGMQWRAASWQPLCRDPAGGLVDLTNADGQGDRGPVGLNAAPRARRLLRDGVRDQQGGLDADLRTRAAVSRLSGCGWGARGPARALSRSGSPRA